MRYLGVAILAAAALAAVGSGAAPAAPGAKTTLDAMRARPDLSAFVGMIVAAGAEKEFTIQSQVSYSAVFAPNNAAIARMPKALLAALRGSAEGRTALGRFVRGHAMFPPLTKVQFTTQTAALIARRKADGCTARCVATAGSRDLGPADQLLEFTVDAKGALVVNAASTLAWANRSHIVVADLKARNGVVHVVDRVVVSPGLEKALAKLG